MPKKKEYEIKAITDRIAISSRASVKVGDSFYTVEYHEERTIPDLPDIDLEMERQSLWDSCNNEVDSQIEDILKTYKK